MNRFILLFLFTTALLGCDSFCQGKGSKADETLLKSSEELGQLVRLLREERSKASLGKWQIFHNEQIGRNTFLLNTENGEVFQLTTFTDVEGEPQVWDRMYVLPRDQSEFLITGASKLDVEKQRKRLKEEFGKDYGEATNELREGGIINPSPALIRQQIMESRAERSKSQPADPLEAAMAETPTFESPAAASLAPIPSKSEVKASEGKGEKGRKKSDKTSGNSDRYLDPNKVVLTDLAIKWDLAPYVTGWAKNNSEFDIDSIEFVISTKRSPDENSEQHVSSFADVPAGSEGSFSAPVFFEPGREGEFKRTKDLFFRVLSAERK